MDQFVCLFCFAAQHLDAWVLLSATLVPPLFLVCVGSPHIFFFFKERSVHKRLRGDQFPEFIQFLHLALGLLWVAHNLFPGTQQVRQADLSGSRAEDGDAHGERKRADS